MERCSGGVGAAGGVCVYVGGATMCAGRGCEDVYGLWRRGYCGRSEGLWRCVWEETVERSGS